MRLQPHVPQLKQGHCWSPAAASAAVVSAALGRKVPDPGWRTAKPGRRAAGLRYVTSLLHPCRLHAATLRLMSSCGEKELLTQPGAPAGGEGLLRKPDRGADFSCTPTNTHANDRGEKQCTWSRNRRRGAVPRAGCMTAVSRGSRPLLARVASCDSENGPCTQCRNISGQHLTVENRHGFE